MIGILSAAIPLDYIVWALNKVYIWYLKMSTKGYFRREIFNSYRCSDIKNCRIVTRPFDKTDDKDFENLFPSLVRDVTNCPEYADMPATNKWLERVLNYNVPFGKKNRGLAVAETYRLIQNSTTEENIRLSFILGWCVEIMQACCLVADDIMDNSEFRRGRLAWFKVDDLGPAAFNDSLFLESIAYFLLKKYFEHLPCYMKLVNEFHNMTHKTLYGQSLDTLTALNKDLSTYTMDHYNSIVKYKTAYYTFCSPVKMAMIFAGIEDVSSIEKLEIILLKVGHYFQVQDDYLDCFGDPQVTGKVGTDIMDTKCTWLFAKAMEIAPQEQRQLLLDVYGSDRSDKVKVVTQIYEDLKLPEIFKSYEDATHKSLIRKISLLNETIPNVREVLLSMLSKLVKRQT